MATYFEPKYPIPTPSGKELKSKWGTALSQNPFILPESGLGQEGMKINPELISAFLETLNLMDQGSGSGLLQPLAFIPFPRTAQWGKDALGSAKRANETLLKENPTLRQFSDTPLHLQPRGYLGKDIIAQVMEGEVHLPFQHGFDSPYMQGPRNTLTTPEKYIKSLLAHEALHLDPPVGGSTISALRNAAATRSDLSDLFSSAEAYKNPATWPGEYVSRVGQQVAVPSIPVARLRHPIDTEWLELMHSYLKNPNLTLKDMEKIAPSLAKSLQSPSYYTPPYAEARQFTNEEVRKSLREDIGKIIQKPGKGGAIGSKKGGGLVEATTPKRVEEDIGNKLAKTYAPDGSVLYVDISSPEELAKFYEKYKK